METLSIKYSSESQNKEMKLNIEDDDWLYLLEEYISFLKFIGFDITSETYNEAMQKILGENTKKEFEELNDLSEYIAL